MISAQISLKLLILFSLSIINSCKKYLTFIDLLRPMHLGSNLNFMLCWVRQLARDNISNYSSSMMSSPMSKIHFQRVRGTYSQQKQKVQSPISSKCYSCIRCQFVSVCRKATIFLTMSSSASVLYINFLLTSTLCQSFATYLSYPKGKYQFIYTTVQSLPAFPSAIAIYQFYKLKQADNYQYLLTSNIKTMCATSLPISLFCQKKSNYQSSIETQNNL